MGYCPLRQGIAPEGSTDKLQMEIKSLKVLRRFNDGSSDRMKIHTHTLWPDDSQDRPMLIQNYMEILTEREGSQNVRAIAIEELT
jgi:hypothetical protein